MRELVKIGLQKHLLNSEVHEAYVKAKAMHREETCQFAVDWFQNCPIGGDVQDPKHAEQYYNETYGGDND